GMTTTGALLDGTAHICLGGIMRSLDLADRGQPFLPHFAEVNSRNGFFLLSRRPRPGFAWADLSGRTLLGFAEAPTPWQCLLTVLRRHGVDPGSVRIERTLPVAEAVAAFRADRADFLEAGQPVLTVAGYEYLQTILLDGGFIRRRHRYEDLVDDAVARHVVETS